MILSHIDFELTCNQVNGASVIPALFLHYVTFPLLASHCTTTQLSESFLMDSYINCCQLWLLLAYISTVC